MPPPAPVLLLSFIVLALKEEEVQFRAAIGHCRGRNNGTNREIRFCHVPSTVLMTGVNLLEMRFSLN